MWGANSGQKHTLVLEWAKIAQNYCPQQYKCSCDDFSPRFQFVQNVHPSSYQRNSTLTPMQCQLTSSPPRMRKQTQLSRTVHPTPLSAYQKTKRSGLRLNCASSTTFTKGSRIRLSLKTMNMASVTLRLSYFTGTSDSATSHSGGSQPPQNKVFCPSDWPTLPSFPSALHVSLRKQPKSRGVPSPQLLLNQFHLQPKLAVWFQSIN